MPAIDLAEVGAGGGSIVWIDAGGALQSGRTAPARCPARSATTPGGTEPTITDANVILGYLNPDYLVGGELRLNAEQACAVFEEQIAQPLGLTLEHAAYGAHRIAASNMIRAIRAVSSERGRDPRDYALFAFGGNGPVFACAHGQGARHAPDRDAAVARPVLGLRPALCRRRASLRAHLPPAAARVEPAALNEPGTRSATRRARQLAAEGFAPRADAHPAPRPACTIKGRPSI